MKQIIIFASALLILAASSKKSFGQSNEKTFVVITFESKYKISEHGVESYYWIVPSDSIDDKLSYIRNITYLEKLLVAGFSDNNICTCLNKKIIEINLLTSDSCVIGENMYYKYMAFNKNVIKSNRRKIQSVTKKWVNGQAEEVSIYATPITAQFCVGDAGDSSKKMYGYAGKVYLPFSVMKYQSDFFHTKKYELISSYDFIYFKFKIIPN